MKTRNFVLIVGCILGAAIIYAGIIFGVVKLVKMAWGG